jgi:HEAT repeat protein
MGAMNITALLLFCLSPALQDSWRDTHRVHLRNGQFLDGRLEQEGDKEVLLRWNPTALVRIRKMEIDRIEEIKIRPLVQVARKPVIRPDKTPVIEGPEPTDTSKEKPPIARPQTDAEKVITRALADPDASWEPMMKELRGLGLEGARSMIAGLPSMDPQRTELVLAALDAMRDVKVEGEIRGLLEAKRPDLRVAGCRLLANRGATGAIRAIVPVLKDGSPVVRSAALSALAILGDESHIETIANLTLDPEASVRERAFRGAEELSVRLKLDNDLVARWLALAGRGPRGSMPEFVTAIGRLTERAGEGFPKADVEARLVEVLSDRDDPARAAAAHALGSLKGSETAAEAIIRALETERQPKVLMGMCEGLGRLKMVRSIEPLIEVLRSGVPEVRSAAQRALERTTGAQDLGTDPEKWLEWFKESKKADKP